MNVKEIVKEYLEKNGYDGLYNVDGECGCPKDSLLPCSESFDQCCPGYRGACDGSCDDPPCDCHIYINKGDALAADKEKAAAEKAG
jgi:hypothetical protein